MGRQLVSMVAMACYTVSLGFCLWNVERLDAVLQVHEELHELEKFKIQVDQLNAHELGDEEASVSMIEMIEAQLAEQKRLVETFFNKAFGRTVQLADFEELADLLERSLADTTKQPQSKAE